MAAVAAAADTVFLEWVNALARRHLADLRPSDVRRGLQALSRGYVERRGPGGASRPRAALDGRGKRAAFALFYGPLHFLVVRHVVGHLGLASRALERVVDLGCGSGAAGAAWALSLPRPRPRLSGVEASGWAADEARWTWRSLGLEGSVRAGDVCEARLPGRGAGIVAAWVVNELERAARDELLERLLDAASAGAALLVAEPIARRGISWWEGWAARFARAGGRADEWRFPVTLPEPLARLDRAAGLDHRELAARTLCLTVADHGA